jgi:tetratricopeptide (TPR) repeat protein
MKDLDQLIPTGEPIHQSSRLRRWQFLALALLAIAVTSTAQNAPSPQTFQQLFHSAERAREQNREDDAIQLYRRALLLRPDSQETLWYLGTLRYGKNEFAPARDTLRVFVALRPDAGAGWAFLGLSEFQLREYPRALDHLQRAMATGMGDNEDLKQSVFYAVSVLLTRFERYDDSMGMLFAIVNSKQCDDPLIDADGLAGLRMPLLPSEIPHDRHKMIQLAGQGLCAAQQGRIDEALKLFTTLRDSYPKEPGVHFLFGSFLMNSRPEDGIAEMKRELEISPSHVPARNRLAEQYTKLGQFDAALKLAQEAKKLAPKNFSVDITLGEALVAKGDVAEGIKELESARDLAPDNIRIRWDLARAYGTVGRNEDAKREKHEIERLNQQNNGPDAKPE